MASCSARLRHDVLDLIRGWLKADILKGLERWTPVQGSPQGAVISPLLANIYLDPLDKLMAERGYRVYAQHGSAMTCGMQTTSSSCAGRARRRMPPSISSVPGLPGPVSRCTP